MDAPTCPGCQQRDEIIAELRQRLVALEERILQREAQAGGNASSSSVPPSANPPDAPKPVATKPTGRPCGAQLGHPPHLRRRLPGERLQHSHDFIPKHYQRCREPLPALPAAEDPEPTWHQVAERPKRAAEITE